MKLSQNNHSCSVCSGTWECWYFSGFEVLTHAKSNGESNGGSQLSIFVLSLSKQRRCKQTRTTRPQLDYLVVNARPKEMLRNWDLLYSRMNSLTGRFKERLQRWI